MKSTTLKAAFGLACAALITCAHFLWVVHAIQRVSGSQVYIAYVLFTLPAFVIGFLKIRSKLLFSFFNLFLGFCAASVSYAFVEVVSGNWHRIFGATFNYELLTVFPFAFFGWVHLPVVGLLIRFGSLGAPLAPLTSAEKIVT